MKGTIYSLLLNSMILPTDMCVFYYIRSRNRTSGASVVSDLSCGIPHSAENPASPRCLTKDEIKELHKFDETNDMEVNEKTGKHRRRRRTCQAKGCKQRTTFECTNPVCKKKPGANNCYGVYYCKVHFDEHWDSLVGSSS